MIATPLSLVALAAAGLVLLTGAYAFSQRIARVEEPPRPAAQSPADEAAVVVTGRCAINHARFGGQRAQMFKVTKDGVANFVVLEIGSKRDPLMRFIRNDWLRMAYGEAAQRVWIGGFGSIDDALARAAELSRRRCAPALRYRLPLERGTLRRRRSFQVMSLPRRRRQGPCPSCPRFTLRYPIRVKIGTSSHLDPSGLPLCLTPPC